MGNNIQLYLRKKLTSINPAPCSWFFREKYVIDGINHGLIEVLVSVILNDSEESTIINLILLSS